MTIRKRERNSGRRGSVFMSALHVLDVPTGRTDSMNNVTNSAEKVCRVNSNEGGASAQRKSKQDSAEDDVECPRNDSKK